MCNLSGIIYPVFLALSDLFYANIAMFPDHIIQLGVHTGINLQELQNEMLQYTRYYPFNAC